MSGITISIQAADATELARLIGGLADAFGERNLGVVPVDLSEAHEGKATVTARTKTSKAKAAKSEPEPETAPANDEGKPEPGPAPETHPVAENVVADLTPAKALEAANKMMQEFFLKDGDAAMKHVTKLQAKYGVRQFADVPEAKAHEFLADVRLATSGAAQAA